MQEAIASIEGLRFDVEDYLQSQVGAQPLPFPGMDKTGAGVCSYYLKGSCSKGNQCPYRHIIGEKTVVCKHWLRGLCKKGDQCEFLHEYNMAKMPECYFFSKYNACSNKECPFRHIDPDSKIKDCQWYDRGFCRHGPACKHRHRRRVMCIAYLNGFCPEGALCQRAHPSFDIPQPESGFGFISKKTSALIVCHNCGELGHKMSQCTRVAKEEIMKQARPMDKKPLSEVTCYKCGDKGHYANRCPKGTMAFLSAHATEAQNVRQQEETQRQQRKVVQTMVGIQQAQADAMMFPAQQTRPGEMKR